MTEEDDRPMRPFNYIRDNPVDDFEVDFFGYKKVAEEVAKSIIQLNPKDGYVLAINGKWGSGKSSFIFYIERYLTDKREELDLTAETSDIIIFKFDPWLFSGHQDIVSQFFIQLRAQCTIEENRFSEKAKQVLQKIFRYGSHLRKVPTLEGQIAGWTFAGLDSLLESQMQKAVTSIFELRDEITKDLKALDEKIVVIIDDIDRLTSEEIRELFRAIKAIADFPNIIYLLAYDEDIVIRALDYEFGSSSRRNSEIDGSRSGIKYLEKIVHFTVPVPAIGDYQFKKYMEEIIFDEKFQSTKPILNEYAIWTDYYTNGLKNFLSTPRSVIRLHNALLLLYPSVENEVNIIDFIVLEVIRQNYPEIYNRIKNNPRFFIEDRSTVGLLSSSHESSDVIEGFHRNLMGKVSAQDQTAISYILFRLFPAYSGRSQGSDFRPSYFSSHSPQKLNMCTSYDTFLKYFRFQVESDLFSNSELAYIINNISDVDKFADHIALLSKNPSRRGSKAIIFFDGILPLIDESIPKDSLKKLIVGCFKIDKSVLNKSDTFLTRSLFPENIADYIKRVLYKSLQVLSRETRLATLKKAFRDGTAFSLMADMIIIIRQQNGDSDWEGGAIYPDAILNLDELEEVEVVYSEHVKNAFSGDLMNFASPNVGTVIFVWNKLNPTDCVLKDAIEKIWQNDNLIVEIICSSRFNNYINPIASYSLEPFKTEDEFREKVDGILKEKEKELHEDKVEALNDFLRSTKRITLMG